MSEPVQRADVPCNGCTLCCHREFIALHPECGDDVDTYETEPAVNPLTGKPGWRLKHKPDGSCIYLGEDGCTIHDRAPIVCREFDCRRFFRMFTRQERRKGLKLGLMDKATLDAGRRRLGIPAPATDADRGRGGGVMRLGYADPPYIGCAHLYSDQAEFSGEIDHAALVDRLQSEYDGWVLHAAATARSMAVLAPLIEKTGARWCSWVKGFAAFKRNVPVAYAWEPVIIKPARKPVVSKRLVMRDWIECPITLRRGLTGAKPEAVCHWAFELLGARPDDELHDLFPGTGAVTRAWATWQGKFALPASPA